MVIVLGLTDVNMLKGIVLQFHRISRSEFGNIQNKRIQIKENYLFDNAFIFKTTEITKY